MMSMCVLKGNLVLSDTILSRGILVVESEKITGIHAQDVPDIMNEARVFDYGEMYIAPGLVDIHLHGALGKDVMDAREVSIQTIAGHQANHGVTGFLGATISAPMDTILDAVGVIKNAAKQSLPSEILGVHVEGPFLSMPEKGAHPASFIKGMTEKDFEILTQTLSGCRAIVSLAPEAGNNMQWIGKLKERGFVVAIGHSDATYDQAMQSFAHGVTHATHLYNAMRVFDHREPGVVGAVLDADDVMAELIVDGIHVHPAALRLAVARKGPENICLITDSMMATGVGDGIYRWGEQEIEVRGSKAVIRGSDVLAGSVLTLNKAVKNMIDWTGVTINQAINMASLNPARVLGFDDEIGSLQVNKLANIVVLDREFQVVETLLRGETVYKKGNQNDR
jgi:N-acetylglucosamine-6-phosphate deacetylase